MHSNASLVALLRDWNFEDKESVQADLAERLSQWLNPLDAIALHAEHRLIQASGADKAVLTLKSTSIKLDVEFRRLHRELLTSFALTKTPPTNRRQTRQQLPQAEANDDVQDDVNDDAAPAYTPYRQHHHEQQRRMEKMIDSFRLRCRQVLAQSSLRHQQLAEVDTAMDQIFGKRERALLSKLPALMERRFKDLKAIQLKTSNATSQETSLLQSLPNRWLDTFEKNFQEALRAELNLRLDPVAGMVESSSTET